MDDIPYIINNANNYQSYRILYENKIFTLSASAKDSKVYLWDSCGAISLGVLLNDNAIIDNLKYQMDIYISEMFPCSSCNKPLSKSEIALTYFAGNYCKNCVTESLIENKKWDYSHLD